MTGPPDPALVVHSRPALALVLLAALLGVLFGSVSCRAPQPPEGAEEVGPEPIPPSLEPIVIPNPNARAGDATGRVREKAPIDAADAGWSEKLDLASGYAAGGFDDQALDVIHAALAQEPPSPWKQRFLTLRTTLRVRRLESEVLRVDIRGVRDYASFATAVDWRLRIRNVSDEPITFASPGRGPGNLSPAGFQLSILRRDLDIYASEFRRSWSQTIYIQQPGGCDVTIPPGGTYEATARTPAEDVGEPISGVRILEVTGALRGLLKVGKDGAESVGLRIRPGRVVILPDGYEPLARDPVGSLQAAVHAVAPTHLLIAAEFVPRGQTEAATTILARVLASGDGALRTAALGALWMLRERNVGQPLATFVTPLLEALRRRPEGANAVMEGLTRVTGQSMPPDARLWEDWWRRTLPTRPRVEAREDLGDAPGGER